MKYKTVLLSTLILFSVICNAQAPELMGDYLSRFQHAEEEYRAGNYTTTIKYCNEILSGIDKVRGERVYRLRAMAHRAQGNYAKAITDYSDLISSVRRDPFVYAELAQVYTCQKEFEKAAESLSDAWRLIKEQQSLKKNNYILEELGRAYHYLGNYSQAIRYLTEAAENQSVMAPVDLMTAYFRNSEMAEVKSRSQAILSNPQMADLLSDSLLYNYVWSLNQLASTGSSAKVEAALDRASSMLRSNNNKCFSGFLNDIMVAHAYSASKNGNDSLAYTLYKKLVAANPFQTDLKNKLDELKVKLKVDVTPPDLAIINPVVDGNNIFNVNSVARYEIYGKANDSAGIESVMVNDVVVKVADDGLFSIVFELEQGRNEIKVVATDANGNKSEKPIIINTVSTTQSVPDELANIPEITPEVKFHAILIGENSYQDEAFKDLKKPEQNVKELKQLLVSNYSFLPENVITIINGKKEEILDSIETKASQLTDNDNLLIFYAGHGTMRKVGNETDGYLIPSDAKKNKWLSYLSENDLREPLRQTEARHILFLVDACYAGALFRATIDDAPQPMKAMYKHKSRRVLTSGNVEEVADDSHFFEQVKEYLQKNTLQYLSAPDLFTYLRTNAQNNTPQFEKINGLPHHGGEFIFMRGNTLVKQ